MRTWWLLGLFPLTAAAQEKPIEVIEVIGRSDSDVVLPSEKSTEGLFGLAESL